jgi:hypothetical protein
MATAFCGKLQAFQQGRNPPGTSPGKKLLDFQAEFELHFRAYHSSLWSGDLATATERSALVLAAAERLRSTYHRLVALEVIVELSWVRGDWKPMWAASDQALTMVADLAPYRWHLVLRARLELEVGSADAGARYLARYLAELDSVGRYRNLDNAVAAVDLALMARLTGDKKLLDRAWSAGTKWIDLEEEPSIASGPRLVAIRGLFLVAALRGDGAMAAHLRPCIFPGMSTMGEGHRPSLARELGILELALGDADAAVQHFDQVLAQCRKQAMGPN